MILVLVVFYAATASMSIFEWHPLLVFCFELVGLDLPTCFVLFPIIVASIARVTSLAHKFFRFSLFPFPIA